jgi:hypothetical protein
VSDFWKDRRPQMTEDEDRRLWERVRAIPTHAGSAAQAARGPAWRRWLAVPSVRYGASALVVALFAVLWVVQRDPRPPAVGTARGPTTESEPAPLVREAPPEAAREGASRLEVPGERAPRAHDGVSGSTPTTDEARSKFTAPPTALRKDAGASQEVGVRVQERRVESGATSTITRQTPPAPPSVKSGGSSGAPVGSASDVAPAPSAAYDLREETQTSRATGNTAGKALLRATGESQSDEADSYADARSKLARGTLPRGSDVRVGDFVAAVVNPDATGPLFDAAPSPFAPEVTLLVATAPAGPARVRVRAQGDTRVDVFAGVRAQAGESDEWTVATGAGGSGVVAVLRLRGARSFEATFEPTISGSWGVRDLGRGHASFEGAPDRLQAAILAVEFARALRAPAGVPRARVAAILSHARALAARGQGTTGLVGFVGVVEDAVRVWPTR